MRVAAIIVDDSPVTRRIIRHHLTRLGCRTVGEAENAARALDLFRNLKPDVVTLDVMMPAVNGTDAMSAFRTMKKEAPDVAIIVVSSLPFDKTRDSYLKEGALAYVVKPFNQFSFEAVRQKLLRAFPELTAQ